MPKEITVKSALHYHKRKMPGHWDLNPYRGCSHGCTYCFAQYTHFYMNSTKFFNDIFVKVNIAEALEKKLKSKQWKREQIKIGGVTDGYQPIEKRYQLMPDVLKVIIKYNNPLLIATKSDLVLRDFELIKKLAQKTDVVITTTITTLDEEIRKKIEPLAPPSKRRFEMLAKFQAIGCKTVVLIMPIIPCLTDSRANIEAIFSQAKQQGVNYIIADALNLKGTTKDKFFSFIRMQFPQYIAKYERLYQTAFINHNYSTAMRRNLRSLRYKYKFTDHYHLETPKEQQLKMF